MADFTALKTAIQNAIKQNGNNAITGNLLQDILISMVSTLGDSAINGLVSSLGTETTNRQNADGTLQSAINTINTKLGEGYVYLGIATPTTNPSTPSGKVFYIAVAAGTYTNFLNSSSQPLVLTQGINILKYNGTSWSLEQLWSVDDVPTAGSNNLVKSGGVLDSIIKDGSAFDLSAYNSGATYADLSAALTALNALPADFKNGGMSFKFVLTSDNKYVQARCMAQNFTTDVTQWQSVDDEPTAGSDNLVKSGGVEQNFKIFEFERQEINPEWNVGEIKANGFLDISSTNYRYSTPMLISANTAVLYGNVYLYSGTAAICSCSYVNGNISNIKVLCKGVNGQYKEDVVYVKEETYIIVVCNHGTEEDIVLFSSPFVLLDKEDGKNIINQSNLYTDDSLSALDATPNNITPTWNQGIIFSNGTLDTSNQSYRYSTPILLEKGSTIMYRTQALFSGTAAIVTCDYSEGNISNINVIYVGDSGLEKRYIYTAEESTYIIVVKLAVISDEDIRLSIVNCLTIKEIQNKVSLIRDVCGINDKSNINVTWNTGAILADGTVDDRVAYSHTSPFLVEAGKTLFVEGLNYYGVALLSKCDAEGNNFTLIERGSGSMITKHIFVEKDTYFRVCIVTGSEYKVYTYLIDNLQKIISRIKDNEDKINPYSCYQYIGEKINLNKYRKDILTRINIGSEGMLNQSMAVFGNKAVILNDATSGQYKNLTCRIVDIQTGNQLAFLTLAEDQIPSNSIHANSCSFGTEFANENSIFPLLYVSQWSGSHNCYVYDIQLNDDVFSASLVQTISCNNISTDLRGRDNSDWVVDVDNSYLYYFGYKTGVYDTYAEGNREMVLKFNLPKLSDGASISFSQNDIIDNYEIPPLNFKQDMCYFNGHVYCLRGAATKPEWLRLTNIDLIKKQIVTDVDLSVFSVEDEPEGIDVYKGIFAMTYNDAIIYSLEF